MTKTESPTFSDLERIYLELRRLLEPISVDSLTQLAQLLEIQAHLAILIEPYLGKIINGEKTIESRFTQNRVIPFKSVSSGDIIFLKRSSGPMCAITFVQKALYFEPMSGIEVENLFSEYGRALCVEPNYVASKLKSKFASLFILGAVLPICPIRIQKLDKRPWVRLYKDLNFEKKSHINKNNQLSLFFNDNPLVDTNS